MINDRRKQFLVSRALQFRYMAYIFALMAIISGVIVINLYFGIWGGILEAFSNTQIQNDLLTASRITEYEVARTASGSPSQPLSYFREAEKLSLRQKEVFKQILDDSNKKLVHNIIPLLLLTAIGSIFVSHKIAGPLHHFQIALESVSKGNLKVRVHLRKFDEAHFLAYRFNRTIQNLDFTLSRLKIICRSNESNPEKMKTRLNEELSKFKTSAD